MGLPTITGKSKLEGSVDLGLFALSDIGPNGFCCAFHRFRGHLQARQDFHLFSTVIKRCLLPNHGLHAAYSGREFRILDIQFDVDGKLPSATVRAQIVGTQNFHPPQGRQHELAAQFAVVGLLAARTR